MSTTNDNETKANAMPKYSSVPDGKSDLPAVLPDFPPPTSGGSGDSGDTTTK
jgi:hypothetical protein